MMLLEDYCTNGYCCHKASNNDYNQAPPAHSEAMRPERPLAQPYVWSLVYVKSEREREREMLTALHIDGVMREAC